MSAETVASRLIRTATADASRDLSKAMYDALERGNPHGFTEQWVAGYLAACEAMKQYGERVAEG